MWIALSGTRERTIPGVPATATGPHYPFRSADPRVVGVRRRPRRSGAPDLFRAHSIAGVDDVLRVPDGDSRCRTAVGDTEDTGVVMTRQPTHPLSRRFFVVYLSCACVVSVVIHLVFR